MASIVKMPQLGLTMEEGTIVKWKKKEGDRVVPGDVLVDVETDKLTSEILSEFEGTLIKIVAQEGVTIPVQGVIAYIGEPGEKIEEVAQVAAAPEAPAKAETVAEKAAAQAAAPKTESTGRIKISPFAKKTAKSMNVDYSNIAGSGPGGRIIQRDIIEASKQVRVEVPVLAAQGELMGGDEIVAMSAMRKTVAQRMYKSHSEIPTVTTTSKIDVTKLVYLQQKLKEDNGKKYSLNDFILKAVVKVLQSNREFLVSISDNNKIIKRAHINLGMAVALDEGLIVPVIRDADRLGLDALASAARDLSVRARAGELSPDEYAGSTFTVSNMGMLGIESFTPIINQPNAAILGVCEVQDELYMDNDRNVSERKVMRISLTWDHRLVDGSTAAKFHDGMKGLLEDPMMILL